PPARPQGAGRPGRAAQPGEGGGGGRAGLREGRPPARPGGQAQEEEGDADQGLAGAQQGGGRGGRRGGDQRGGLQNDRRGPGQDRRGRDQAALEYGGRAAQARGQPARADRGHRPGGAQEPGGDQGPQAADRQFHLRGADGGGQDALGQAAGGVHVRRRERAG